MLRITVELVPHSDNAFKQLVAGMHIINIGKDEKGGHNYVVQLYEKTFEDAKQITIYNWKRARPVWALIFEALRKIRMAEYRDYENKQIDKYLARREAGELEERERGAEAAYGRLSAFLGNAIEELDEIKKILRGYR